MKTIDSIKLTDAEIECAFIFLSRGGHLSELEKDERRKNLLSSSHLKEKVKGFDSQDITLLFPQTKTMSSVHDEEDASEQYTELEKDDSVKEEEPLDEPEEDEEYSEIVDDDDEKAAKSSEVIDDDIKYSEPVDDEMIGDGEMIDEEVEDEVDDEIIKNSSEVEDAKMERPAQVPKKESPKQVDAKTDLHKEKALPAPESKAGKDGEKPMDDEVRAVIESIKKENERVKLIEESKFRSSKESEKGEAKNIGQGEKKEGTFVGKEKPEEQKVDDSLLASTGARKMTENSKKDGQVIFTTRSDVDYEQQESISPS